MNFQPKQIDTVEGWVSFASAICFEINNPLSAVRGFAELAQQGLDPEHPVAGHVKQIVLLSERISQVTQALSALVRAANETKRGSEDAS
jgi:C4-dicarboxylate-specific signal transduction histidine kinase